MGILSRPACWRWKPPTEDDISRKTEEIRLKLIDIWGSEERALLKTGSASFEEDARWYLMQRFQKGRCGMCGYSSRYDFRLVLDHDHGTGLIRGYLCRTCNTLEGCSGGDVFDLYRERNPATICGLKLRYAR